MPGWENGDVTRLALGLGSVARLGLGWVLREVALVVVEMWRSGVGSALSMRGGCVDGQWGWGVEVIGSVGALCDGF